MTGNIIFTNYEESKVGRYKITCCYVYTVFGAVNLHLQYSFLGHFTSLFAQHGGGDIKDSIPGSDVDRSSAGFLPPGSLKHDSPRALPREEASPGACIPWDLGSVGPALSETHHP